MAHAFLETPQYEKEGIQLNDAKDIEIIEFIKEYKLHQIEESLINEGITVDFLLNQTQSELEETAKELSTSSIQQRKLIYAVQQRKKTVNIKQPIEQKEEKQTNAPDHVLKILLVGDAAVGKTCLLLSFTSDEYDPETRSTIGVDLKVKIVHVRGKKIKLTIWDTAGQERFRTLTSAYYRGAQGVILVYDITRKDTFDNIGEWMKEVDIFTTKENVIKVLVGNKIDLETWRTVSRSDGVEFAQTYNMLFFEASAKTKLGVNDAFIEMVEKILDSTHLLQENTYHNNINFPSNSSSDNQGCFCL